MPGSPELGTSSLLFNPSVLMPYKPSDMALKQNMSEWCWDGIILNWPAAQPWNVEMLGTYDANLYVISTLWMEEVALVYQLYSRNAFRNKSIICNSHPMACSFNDHISCRNLREICQPLEDVFHEEKTVGIHNTTHSKLFYCMLSLCNKSSRNISRGSSLIILIRFHVPRHEWLW